MAAVKLQAKVKIAWWFKFYAFGVIVMSRLTGLEPDEAKVTAWAKRAVSIKIIKIIKGRKA